MSYASVAAHNAPPVSEQPQPDPSLLNTAPSTHPDVADETSKVNIVSADFKEHPATVTSEFAHNSSALFTSGHSDPDESRVKKNVAAVDSEATSLWEKLKNTVLRPSVVGGLVGVGASNTINSSSHHC
ncbi:hypothetical protein OF83DRAFT_1180046 [Amylostereum chailletii]|nr:hypothetical protein OF83DRAFT_1180046 [Amylostereum chailletii]